MAHLHITAWVLAIILLFVVFFMYKGGSTKPAKIIHMILRLDYLLILYSGGSLFASYDSIGFLVIIKVIVGIWVIVAMEMIGVKASKGKPTNAFWIQFVITALIAIILGFGFLPLGILP